MANPDDKGLALVTGGAVRVGRATSLHLAGLGYDVAIHCHGSREAADTLQAEIEGQGRRAFVFVADLMSSTEAEALVHRVFDAHPDCCVLVNNASRFERSDFDELDEAILDRQLQLNLKTPLFAARAFGARCANGQVINVLDTYVRQSHGTSFAYLLSKKALASATQMLAHALAPNIRVNAIAPGLILSMGSHEDSYEAHLRDTTPLKRVATLDDYLHALGYLLDANSTTGQVCYVDAGYTLP